nr:tetratricopeptide repeat protein [Deltaproteobacteria bacterium]
AARCHLDLGNTDKAKELLETVIKRYPNTEEAQKAQEMMFSQEEYEMEPDMEEEYEMEPDTEIEVEEIEREMEE